MGNEAVSGAGNRKHRPLAKTKNKKIYITDLRRYVCRSDGGCGGHGDGALLSLKSNSDTIF